MFQEPGPKNEKSCGSKKNNLKKKKKNSPVGTNPFPLKDIWKQSLGVSLKCANINSAGYCNSPFSWSPSPLHSHTHPPLDLLVSALDRDNSFPGSLSLTVADGDGTGRLKNPGSTLAIKSAGKKGSWFLTSSSKVYILLFRSVTIRAIPPPPPHLHPPTLPQEERRVRRSPGSAVEWFTRGVRVTPCGHLSPGSCRIVSASEEHGMGAGWLQTHAPTPRGDFSPLRVSEAVGLPKGGGRGAPVWLSRLSEPPPGFSQTWGFWSRTTGFLSPCGEFLLTCCSPVRGFTWQGTAHHSLMRFQDLSIAPAWGMQERKKVLTFKHTFACEIASCAQTTVESWMVWAKAGESPCTSLSHCEVRQRTSHLLIQIQTLRAVPAHAVKPACCRCKTIKPKCSQAHQQPDLDAFKV